MAVRLRAAALAALVLCAVGAAMTPRHHEYCIVGAGPAGVQLAYFLHTSPEPRDYIVFERAANAGSYFETYPRHRTLISINKRYTGSDNFELNMRHDWNSLLTRRPAPSMLFRNFDKEYFPAADSLVSYLRHFAQNAAATDTGAPRSGEALRVEYNTTVVEVSRGGGGTGGAAFVLRTAAGDRQRTWSCDRVVVATGLFAPMQVNPSPLIEWYDTMPTNKSSFEGQEVLVLGRGNAAFETANHLYGVTARVNMIGRSRVRLSWETHYVGDVRGVNNEVLDSYMLKSLDICSSTVAAEKLHFVRDNQTNRIHVYDRADVGTREEMDELSPVDRVLGCTGWKFDETPFRDAAVRPDMKTPKYPQMTPDFESTNVPGLFFAGTVMHSRDWRKSSGGFIHGFRYLVRAMHRQMEVRFHRRPWPQTKTLRPKVGGSQSAMPAWHRLMLALRPYMLQRINEASGLYQLFGYLMDVAVLRPDGNGIDYLHEVPADYIADCLNRTHPGTTHYFTVDFEYGRGFSGPGNDTFNPKHIRQPDFDHQHGPGITSRFLHPVIRLHRLPSQESLSKMGDCDEQDDERAFSKCFEPTALARHEMMEEVKFQWTDENDHVEPLDAFLTALMSGGADYPGEDAHDEDSDVRSGDEEDEL